MQYLIAVIVLIALLVGGFALLNRPLFFSIDAEIAADFPVAGFSHRNFEFLLERYVSSNGDVDYAAWHSSDESVARLRSYLAAVSRFSPDATPDRFPSQNDELAYWLYAYNAYVILTVLDKWPIESVTDVKAPIEAIKGMGFFYQLRFAFGGEKYSLLGVENQIIRKRYQDARIHFLLNCASDSCPVMRPELPTGESLQALLASATIDFVGDRKNVWVDHANTRIVLSTIFKWFKKDFLNDMKMRGLPAQHGVVDYVVSVAPDPIRAELESSISYDIEFREYDWSLNSVEQR